MGGLFIPQKLANIINENIFENQLLNTSTQVIYQGGI
jgi:hypothetical protein